MFSSAAQEFSAQGGAGGTPWGPGAASAESCTHPAKRDRCFPPPIAERQRLPNVGGSPLGATWWETFHWGLTCIKRLTTGELTPNKALSKNLIVRYWIIWSTIWAWPNVDWTVTILSDSSLFISGHYVSWDSYIYYPLFKILSLFGWIHHCTTMLCFSVELNSFFIYKSSGTVSKLYLTMVYHLKNNGFISYQFIIFD